MEKLDDLYDAGQSVWLDFIKRDMLASGELDSLVAAGIRGVLHHSQCFCHIVRTLWAHGDLRQS